ncbi:MAG: glucosaminidase domain-containing protein [Clostridiales Family XIII bacterium]|jgi:flagellum-specific peptidoglycan hydrolase FlgJ|nr:glucosaminidase domain-containing protein [Clostridiales Family XIII bacterium]
MKKKRKRKIILAIFLILLFCLISGFFIVKIVKKQIREKEILEAQKPLDKNSKKLIEVKIDDGMNGLAIANMLAEKKIIKSAEAFYLYAISNSDPLIKTGTYYLSPANDVPYIFDDLVSGGEKGLEKYKEKFIKKHISYAKQLYKEYGVLPSVNLSQMILESDWGRSKLAKVANNYYGIKASESQAHVTMETNEHVDGKIVTENAIFAEYKSWKESMKEHSILLIEGNSYNPDIFDAVIKAKDYKEAASELQKAGYATDPDYAKMLISIIEKYNLNKYDE